MKNTIKADFKNKTWKRKKKKAAIKPRYEKLTLDEMRANLAGAAEKERLLAEDRADRNRKVR